MDYGVWRVGGQRFGFLRVTLLASLRVALLASLASCTEPRDTSGTEPIGVGDGGSDGGDAAADVPTKVDAPATDARPDGDAAREGGAAAHLVIDKTAHDFGQVLVNTPSATAEFAVSNDGGAASGAVSAAFVQIVAGFSVKSDECANKPLAVGARCRVAVIFSPTAAGKVQASLRFTAPGFDVTATLTAEGITPGALKVAPLMLDFGAVVPPGASSSQTFTVTNTGQQKSGVIATSLTGTDSKSFEVTADGCVGQILAAQQMCQVTVRFTPTGLGGKSIPLKLAADPGGSAIAQLEGTGITPSTVMFIPGSFEFGLVPQNKAGPVKQFTVQNKGQATTATLSSAVSTADFMITNDTCMGHTLVANATCAVSVQFLPASGGSKIATVSVTELGGGPATAQLTGTGQFNPSLKVTPTSKDFNAVTIGLPATATFQVSNDGDLPSTVPTPTITGTDLAMFSVPTASNGCTAPIPAKGSCMMVVRFDPASTGAKSAMLTVAATAGGSSSATLAGTGNTPGQLKLNLPSFDFHGIEQNTVSPVATFTVTNSGQSSSGPVTASIVGTTVFTIVSNLCNQMTLGPSNSCSLTVRFEPVTPGPASGTLQITGNPGGTATTSLSGTGLAPAQLIINPTTFSFPSTVVGATSANQTFTVTNSGGVAAGSSTGLVGVLARTDAADFKVVTSNCTGMLAAGNSCMMVVAFAPKSAGDKSASVSVTGTPGGNAVAAISGMAQNPAKLTVTAASGSSSAFGNVLLTAMSDKTFVVTNTGDQSSSAVGITLTTGSGFALLPATTGECMTGTTTLAGGGSCTVRVRFAPTVAGSQTATLGASATTGGTASLGLTGNGQRNAQLNGTNSNNFGTVVVNNTTGTINWMVSNGGDINSGLPVLTASNNEVLVTSNGCTGVIGPSGSCVIGVAFRPSASGSRMGVLTLTASPGGSVTFTANANGQTVAGLGLAPAAGSGTNFGDVLVGNNQVETFVLTNTGQQPTTAVTVSLTTVAGSGFALVTPPATGECVTGTTTLAGGTSCNIRVRFTAPAGMQNASLAATATAGGTATALALIGNGQRQAALMGTTTNNFMTVVVGTTTTPAVTWTINNMNGDVPSGIPTLMNSNPSEVIVGSNTCSVAVAAKGQCTISVSFRPSSDGMRSGTLTLTATPGGSVTFSASATGQKPALLSLAPDATSSTNFGNDVLVGASVTETFVVTNTGQQASTPVTFALTTMANSGFTLVPPATGECVTGTTVLGGGLHCNIRVTFLAPHQGVQTASLSASAVTGGTPAPLSLTATGQRAAKLTGSTSNDFGSIVVGAPSGSVTWTVTNGGDMPTSVPTLANNNPAEVIVGTNNCTAMLGAGGTCTIIVSFLPADIGARSGTLTLTASGTSVTFAASATGLSKASLALGPQQVPLSSVNFGSVLLGDNQDEVFVATNGGQGPTSAIALTFSGDDFMLMPQAGDCANGTMLAPMGMPGATCLIHVRFHPTANVMRTAALQVSAMTGGSGALTLMGLGRARATLTLTAQSGQPTTDLGYVLVGDSATATFVLKNNGDQTASGISVLGLPAGAFSRGTNPTDDCGATLDGGKTCQVRAIFTPTAGGMSTTTVSVSATTGGNTASFMVTGIGQPKAVFTPITIPTTDSGPNGIALSSDGSTVWFTETTAAKIGRLDLATQMVTDYPLPNAMGAPIGIAAATDSMWFTESGTNTIGQIATADNSISEFPMMVGGAPTGIARGADDAFWFTEASGNSIGQMTTTGAYNGGVPVLSMVAKPQGIALGPDKNLWFTEPAANNVGTLPNTGPPVVEQSVTLNAGPFGIAAGNDGRMWFTEQNGNKIGAVTTTGTMAVTEYSIPTANSQPAGITQGADHFIWFVEQSGGKLARITPDGVVTEFAMPAGSAPQAIVSAGAGTFYLTDPGTNHIWKVTF